MRPEFDRTVTEIGKAIAGKRPVIERIVTALLADGHVLMDDVPGTGKTTLAIALSKVLGLAFVRMQFTPDVLPSDLLGFSVYDKQSGGFIYRPGSLNQANLLLGDEINRASSKTQSALLEAMEERRVTVDGISRPLRTPFLVIATQNSIDAEGTWPLPFAQMDRFAVRLALGYPDHDAQVALLKDRQESDPLERVQCVLSAEEFIFLQKQVRSITASDAILDYIARLSVASRTHPSVVAGISPRGTLFLDRMAKAIAWADGRDYVTGADVRSVFFDVCAHRILLRKSDSISSVRDLLEELLRTVESPDRRSLFFGVLKK